MQDSSAIHCLLADNFLKPDPLEMLLGALLHRDIMMITILWRLVMGDDPFIRQ